MTTTEINKKLAGLLGIPWHEKSLAPVLPGEALCSCGFLFSRRTIRVHTKKCNIDFCADPRLVLREMMKREGFVAYLEERYSLQDIFCFLTDTTGNLAVKAIEWLEKQNEGGEANGKGKG
jgi:hypothetical protein